MSLVKESSSLVWDGEVTFGVLDEELVRSMGLLDNPAALLHAIEAGTLQFKRTAKNHNTVTNYARQSLVEVMTGTAPNPLPLPSQMELGTGSGTPAATDTDLWAPAAATMKPLSQTNVYLSYFAQYICTWQTSDPIQGTWSEIGLKDSSGNLWAHAAVNITINPGEMLVGQWQIQIVGN